MVACPTLYALNEFVGAVARLREARHPVSPIAGSYIDLQEDTAQ
jgi:hypothetical protein